MSPEVPDDPRPHVLVVDDHRGLRAVVAKSLVTKLGASVKQASDIPAALLAGSSEPPFDVVLVDLNLPSGNTLDVVSELRERHPRAGLVLMSAGLSAADRSRAAAAQVDVVDKTDGLGAIATAVVRAVAS